MKKLYICLLLISGTGSIFAQETSTEEKQELPKEAVAANAKLYENKTAEKQEKRTTIVSEEGLNSKATAKKSATAPSGNTIPGNSDIYAIKASIPGRQTIAQKQPAQKKPINGLPNTATLAEIKKTIPKD
ncbi:hypothetical protein [Epilithonimonas sp.]|uniref:hypothetical protein n=1 Tax=Epilithonimonas sp. TaxID=2894511 RepID=UPI002896439C|nr:hypothetical protein [Epilithonimonas sp.]